MDAVARRAALGVVEVRVECLAELAPGRGPVEHGEHGCVHDAAQRGAVGAAGQVVVDGAEQVLGGHRVTEAGQHLHDFVRAEQIEQHQHVGLLGEPVAVGAVPL